MPVTTMGDAAPLPLTAPQVAVKLVTGAPPFVGAAVKPTVTWALPPVALPMVGAAGTAMVTLRTRAPLRSGMYRLPAASKVTKLGSFIFATRAGPPSPGVPTLPLPAMVVMTPLVATLRKR